MQKWEVGSSFAAFSSSSTPGNMCNNIHSTTELGRKTDLLLYLDVELLDSLQCELLLLDQDPDGVSHEPLCHIQDIHRHRSRQQNHLGEVEGRNERVTGGLN